MRTPSIALLAAAVLALSACGDDGDDADAPDTGAAEDQAVAIVDNAFDPDGIEVGAGGTVEWEHTGSVAHNVTFDDEASDTLNAGDTYSRTFDEAGEFDYECTFHPGMDGTVTVSG